MAGGRSVVNYSFFLFLIFSLVAQLVKNPPAMWETWVRSLCWEDPLEKGKATHSGILDWRIPRTGPWGPKESDPTERLSLSLLFIWLCPQQAQLSAVVCGL